MQYQDRHVAYSSFISPCSSLEQLLWFQRRFNAICHVLLAKDRLKCKRDFDADRDVDWKKGGRLVFARAKPPLAPPIQALRSSDGEWVAEPNQLATLTAEPCQPSVSDATHHMGNVEKRPCKHAGAFRHWAMRLAQT